MANSHKFWINCHQLPSDTNKFKIVTNKVRILPKWVNRRTMKIPWSAWVEDWLASELLDKADNAVGTVDEDSAGTACKTAQIISYTCTLHNASLENLYVKISNCLCILMCYVNVYTKNVQCSLKTSDMYQELGSKFITWFQIWVNNQYPVSCHYHIKYHQFLSCICICSLFISFRQYLKAVLTIHSSSFDFSLFVTNAWHVYIHL